MIAIFLPSYPFRGVSAPYLWVFYRFLHSLKERTLFILGEEYLADTSNFENANRPELTDSAKEYFGFEAPTAEIYERHEYAYLDNALFQKILAQTNENPIEAFKLFLTNEIPDLTVELEKHLTISSEQIEFVVTWCNCPSLTAVASKLDIQTIHLELGPLRHPHYRFSGYVDFKGVNGNTDAKNRYLKCGPRAIPDIPMCDLLELFSKTIICSTTNTPKYRCGVALQIENDSNLVAYGNSFNNLSLLTVADSLFGRENYLVRTHPGSNFKLDCHQYQLDNSASSIEFINKCDQILTVNSSVGLEAILRNVPTKAMGECSYSFILDSNDENELRRRTVFYLLSYLAPYELIFETEYLKFRASNPSESDILDHHLKFIAPSIPPEKIDATSFSSKIKSMVEQIKIQNLQKKITSLQLSNTQQLQEIKSISEEINFLKSQIAEQEVIVEEMNSLKSRIVEQEKMLLELGLSRTHLISDLAVHEETITELELLKTDLHKELSALQDATTILKSDQQKLINFMREEEAGKLDFLNKQIHEQRKQISDLLNSTSWKISKPVRMVKLCLKNAKSVAIGFALLILDTARRAYNTLPFDHSQRVKHKVALSKLLPMALNPTVNRKAIIVESDASLHLENPFSKSNKKRILIVDALLPKPDRDSGSVDVLSYIQVMLSLNFDITFISCLKEEKEKDNIYAEPLKNMGVECLPSENVNRHLIYRGDEYDIVMLYRANFAAQYIDCARAHCSTAKIIFNTVDLHFLRLMRQAELENSATLKIEAEHTKFVEYGLIEKADKTIVISRAEYDILIKDGFRRDQLSEIPLIRDIPGKKNTFDERKDIVFIGGFLHQPNIDAVKYFVEEIWPFVREMRPDIEFFIVGSNMPIEISSISAPGVRPVGYVEDIGDYFNRCKISVAPLRYGAGLKGKVGASLAYGVPCIISEIAYEGTGLEDGDNIIVAKTPRAFSESICSVYEDADLWNRLSDSGLIFAQQNYSINNGRELLNKLLELK